MNQKKFVDLSEEALTKSAKTVVTAVVEGSGAAFKSLAGRAPTDPDIAEFFAAEVAKHLGHAYTLARLMSKSTEDAVDVMSTALVSIVGIVDEGFAVVKKKVEERSEMAFPEPAGHA